MELVIAARVYSIGYSTSRYTFIVLFYPLGNIVKCVETFLPVKMTGKEECVLFAFGALGASDINCPVIRAILLNNKELSHL